MKSLILRYSLGCLFGLLMALASAQAARLDDLFEVEVAAMGRDNASRDAAMQLALQQVLVRVTGLESGDQRAAAGVLLQQPGRFVEQYHFREAGEQLRMWVKFDGVTLAREVRHMGLPYWGPDRPDTLVWLAVDNQGQRYIAAESSDSEATRMLRATASARGLPVTLPLMDLQDRRSIEFTDIWGGFPGALESASQRYRPQVILVGKVGRAGASGWRGDWTLTVDGNSQNWGAHAATLSAAVAGGVAAAAEWLAIQYAVGDSAQSMRRLVVEGIAGLEDYGRVYNYLASLTPVEQVQVAHVNGADVEFDLQLNAQEQTLLQLITLGRTLRAVDDPAAWRFRISP